MGLSESDITDMKQSIAGSTAAVGNITATIEENAELIGNNSAAISSKVSDEEFNEAITAINGSIESTDAWIRESYLQIGNNTADLVPLMNKTNDNLRSIQNVSSTATQSALSLLEGPHDGGSRAGVEMEGSMGTDVVAFS